MTDLKIKLHSTTDLITNSSTVIFTYSSGSLKVCKEMIDEILKTFDLNKTCDDLFNLVVLADLDAYLSYLGYGECDDEDDDKPELPNGIDKDNVEKQVELIYNDVLAGTIKKPAWFKNAEQKEDDYNCFTPETNLYIIAKEDKYKKAAELVHKFLYSTHHEATRDG